MDINQNINHIINIASENFTKAEGYGVERHMADFSLHSNYKNYQIEHVTIPKMSEGKLHVHNNSDTLVYHIQGKSHIYYGKEMSNEKIIDHGDCLLIPMGVYHKSINPYLVDVVAIIFRVLI